MYKKMKKQMATTIIVIVAICVVAIVAMGVMVSGEIYNEIDRVDINEVKDYQIGSRGGVNARSKVTAILDYFGTDDEGYYYIIPYGEDQYIGMYVENSLHEKADVIAEETYDYLVGDRDTIDAYIQTRGTVYRMDEVCYEYFQDWFVETEYLGGNSLELIDKYTVDYLYVVESVGLFQLSNNLILAGGGSIIILVIMILVIIIMPVGSIKKVKKYIANNGLMLEAVESDYMNGLRLNGKYVFGRKYVFYPSWFKIRIVESSDVIWIYKHLQVTEHSVYGIKTHTTSDHSVFVKLRSGKCIAISSKNDSHSDDIVMALNKLYPCAFAGWSQELQTLCSKNYPELIRLVDERRRGIL